MKIPDIKTSLPGPKAYEIIEKDKKTLVLSTKVSDFCPERGYGCVLEDVDGNKFLDFSAGVAVANLGYSHPRIIKVIKEQVEKLIHGAGQDFYNKPQVDYANILREISPGDDNKKIFFSNSGTESVEAAAKIARWNRSVLEVVSFVGAFHGRTMGSLAFTASKPIQQKRFLPTIGGVHVPYAYCYRCVFKMDYPSCGTWCANYLKEVCFETFLPPDEVAAIIIEPVQGEGGYVVPPPKFIPKIK
ncbi:MAG: aminotransferase class III-fold pyridoxal phosphate-dependent enzyme, partial [Candidatus Lokiarchaeota archaeon]|nr:aminotransferase class III-fold pyridoxal phosphate-dependent enzyme [Candidatus Lokiarchaeota archaeon]